MKENLLVDLSKQFAVNIINLCSNIKENRKSNVLLNQLLRSGTSIGANIHEANYASSKADFINKMQIALKECYETDYWLSIFKETNIITENEYKDMFAKCSKIRKILVSSITTAKNPTANTIQKEIPQTHEVHKYDFINDLETFFEKHPNLLYPSVALKEYNLRNNGKIYDINEHCKALILSKISNRQKWYRIEEKMDTIQKIFFDYDCNKILNVKESYFIEQIKKIKCGSQVTDRVFSNLHQNIQVLLTIEKNYGSIDSYLLSKSAHKIVEDLSSADSSLKMKTIGPALAWEYLRNVGIDGAKPDVHLKRILSSERLHISNNKNISDDEFFTIMTDMKNKTGKLYLELDCYLWSYCADGQAKICSADPHCNKCVIQKYCKNNSPKGELK